MVRSGGLVTSEGSGWITECRPIVVSLAAEQVRRWRCRSRWVCSMRLMGDAPPGA